MYCFFFISIRIKKKKLKIYINGISIYNNYKSSFSFFKKNLMNIQNIILGSDKNNFNTKSNSIDNSFVGLIKSVYILNISLTENDIINIFKTQTSKNCDELFEKAFFLNPYNFLSRMKSYDKDRIYSFTCPDNLFFLENESCTQKTQEKTTFFTSLIKTFIPDDKKNIPIKKTIETHIKIKGVFILERFRFRETLLGMGNIDIFLFLIENIAFSSEISDQLFWFFLIN